MAKKHDEGKNVSYRTKLAQEKDYQEALKALDQLWYLCPHCVFKAKEKEDLVHHLTNNHAIIVGLYKCPYCDHKSEDRSLVREHIWNKHVKKIRVLWEKYKCLFCGFRTDKLDDLSNHFDITH